jgi:hypothetical protein
METTFEEMEKRRLDQDERRLALLEREITIREEAFERDAAKYGQDVDSNIADREDKKAERAEDRDLWKAHRDAVEAANRHHGEILERIATALERMAEAGATIK